jgi:hypothetical protein
MEKMSGWASLEPLKKARTAGGCRLKTRHARYIGNYLTKRQHPCWLDYRARGEGSTTMRPLLFRLLVGCGHMQPAGWVPVKRTACWSATAEGQERQIAPNLMFCWVRPTAPPCRIPNLGSFQRPQCNSKLPCLPCPKNRECVANSAFSLPAPREPDREEEAGRPPLN